MKSTGHTLETGQSAGAARNQRRSRSSVARDRRYACADRALARQRVQIRGLAHGLNEIFTVVNISANLLLDAVGDPSHEGLLQRLRRSSDLGAALTRSLSTLGHESTSSTRGNDDVAQATTSASDVRADATAAVSVMPCRVPASEDRIILVVEDHDDVRELLALVLTGAGYVVRTAADSRAALSTLATCGERVGLVIADLILPYMNGWSLAHTVHRTHPQMKFLFITGYPAAVLCQHSDGARGETCLHKPMRVSDVLGRVGQLMADGEQRDAMESNSARTLSARATEGAGWMNETI